MVTDTVIRAAKKILNYFTQDKLERRVVKALALKVRGGVYHPVAR